MGNLYRGQWTGSTDDGIFVIANINQTGHLVTGRVYEYGFIEVDNEKEYVWMAFTFNGLVTDDEKIAGNIIADSVCDADGYPLTDEKLKYILDNNFLDLPENMTFTGYINKKNEFNVKSSGIYKSKKEIKSKAKLKRFTSKKSKIPAKHMSWLGFKKYVTSLKEGYIYRGQARDWPLQTSYHRTGYADLIQYLDFELKDVAHHVNAISKRTYDPDKELGTLLNLIQHHGYPTPLLDWTRSPYIAAFFAFQNSIEIEEKNKINIFLFDDTQYSNMAGRYAEIRSPKNIVRTMTLPSIDNPRALPQQSITMFSNVSDIEGIIIHNEHKKGQYLRRISLSIDDREEALRDLNLMGITWGSMFPGLEGICKQLKSVHFVKL